MKVIMTLLVRDEIDIIKQNIDFHINNGIDEIIVTDNGSCDGTRDILNDLYNEKKISRIIDEPLHHTQSLHVWVNNMGKIAKYEHDAACIIHADADEFWKPRTTYKDVFKGHRCYMVNCNNVVMTDDAEYPSNLKYILKNQVQGDWLSNPLIKYVWKKTCLDVRNEFMELALGNHTLINENLGCNTSVVTNDITVYHLPIRSYPQFEKKIINAGSTGCGAEHLRIWNNIYLNGGLLDLYNSFLLTNEYAHSLLRSGHLEQFNISDIGF